MTAILDTSSCLSVITDRSGRIQRFSPDAERLTGYSSDDVVGHPVWALVAPEDQDRARAKFDQAECIATMCAAVEDWVSRTGQRRSIAWLHTLLDAESACPRVLMTGVDLTEQRLAHGLFESVLDAATGAVHHRDRPRRDHHLLQPRRRADDRTACRRGRRPRHAGPCSTTRPSSPYRAASSVSPDGYDAVLHDVRTRRPRRSAGLDLPHRSGRRLTVSLTRSAMRDRCRGVTGYLTLAEDVSEARAAQRQLQAALAQERELVARLSALDRAKSDFIAAVNHELRTPLTSILGYTDVLLDGAVGGLAPLQRAHGHARRPQRPAAAQAGREPPDPVRPPDRHVRASSADRVDLVGVVSDSVARAAADLKAAGLEVTLELGLVPSPVFGDETQLGRVVSSLIDNAIAFTPPGGRLRLTLRRDRGDAVLEVADDGVGISALRAVTALRAFRPVIGGASPRDPGPRPRPGGRRVDRGLPRRAGRTLVHPRGRHHRHRAPPAAPRTWRSRRLDTCPSRGGELTRVRRPGVGPSPTRAAGARRSRHRTPRSRSTARAGRG